MKVPAEQLNTYKKLFKSKGMGSKAVYKKEFLVKKNIAKCKCICYNATEQKDKNNSYWHTKSSGVAAPELFYSVG